MSINHRTQQMLNQLRQSPYWTDATTEKNEYISGLICPECGQPEAFTYKASPFRLHCNRRDKCGATVSIVELLPDNVAEIERDNPPTPEDPHRPATAYLLYRGSGEEVLEGLGYQYWENVRGTGSGVVMFPITTQTGEKAFNGRLFNPPSGFTRSTEMAQTLYEKLLKMKMERDWGRTLSLPKPSADSQSIPAMSGPHAGQCNDTLF